jgi:hypothetical protein
MKLFSVGKVGAYVDEYKATSEKRKERGEVAVLCLTLRIQPLDHKLATAMDQMVRTSLFKLTGNADPLTHIKATEFHFPFERQIVTVFATPDTSKPSIVFDQVRIMSVRARTEKGVDGYALIIKAQFEHEPSQLMFVDKSKHTQIFITTEEAEPMLDDIVPEDDEDDDDAQGELTMEAPEEQLAAVGVSASRPDRSNRKLHTHSKSKKKKARR